MRAGGPENYELPSLAAHPLLISVKLRALAYAAWVVLALLLSGI
jgi:hypothetical protein